MSNKLGTPYCFISLPFVDSQEDKSLVDNIYLLIKRIVENRGYSAKRIDTSLTVGINIYDQIQHTIKNSAFVIALLWDNQNVAYEMGLSTGLGKDIILISPSELNIPSDLSGIQVYTFKKSNIQEIEHYISQQVTRLHKISSSKGNYNQSLRYLQHDLELAKERGNERDTAATLNNLSAIGYSKGDYDKALQYLEESVEISRKIGDKAGEGVTLNNLAQIYQSRGNYDNALRLLEQSLEISREIGNKSSESINLNNISQIVYARGDLENAQRYLKQSLV